MASARTDPLVSTGELAAVLHDPHVRVLDATYHLPAAGRDAREEFLAAHIPGAAFFDIDRIADPHTDLPHMLPSADEFAAAVGALGVGDGDRVILYDTYGLWSAGRAWWMFRAFGHDDVAILDGGLRAWRDEGRPLESGEEHPAKRTFHAQLRPELVRSRDDVAQIVTSGGAQIVDARSAPRFEGTVPEPRAGLRSGHIPSSRNVPVDALTDPATGRLRSRDELRARFESAGVTTDRPIVTTCGSGVTACALAFALDRISAQNVAVYDGSWSEWGREGPTPVVTGPA